MSDQTLRANNGDYVCLGTPAYRDCRWCHGRGCMGCAMEEENARFAASKPIFTARLDNPQEMEDAKFVIGYDRLLADAQQGIPIDVGVATRALIVQLRRCTRKEEEPDEQA